MKTGIINFSYQAFNSADELPVHYRTLLEKARAATVNAYAPYSLFFVGAAAMLENGETITATNQENASSPVGICAERVLLSAASSVYPGTGITTIAISYSNRKTAQSTQPVFPCGICRQSLLEQQIRQNAPVQLVLGGLEGQVFVINNAADLLPFAFTGKDME